MVPSIIAMGIALWERVLQAVVVLGLLFLAKFLLTRRRKIREDKARAAANGLPLGMVRESAHFRLVRGLAMTDLGGIYEGYMAKPAEEDRMLLTVNVSAERLAEVILALTAEVREPSVLILDVPSRQHAPGAPDHGRPTRRDVFEMDHMTHARFASFFRRYAELLVHDGQTWLWYGTGDGRDYVLVGLLKMVRILTDDPAKYMRVLDQLGYTEEPQLLTAADNVSADRPACAFIIEAGGKSVYDMVDAMKRDGLYLLETREE